MKYTITILLAIFLVVSVFAFKSCSKKEKEIKQIEKSSEVRIDTLVVFIDKDSVKHFQKEIEVNDLRSALILNRAELEKTKNKLGITLGQITEFEELKANLNFRIKEKNDTVFSGLSLRKNFHDKFTDCDISIDSINSEIFCSVNVPLTITNFWKKKHKFLWFIRRRKIETVDYSSENPNVVFTSVEKIKIQK